MLDPFGLMDGRKTCDRPFWETNGLDKVPSLNSDTGYVGLFEDESFAVFGQPVGFAEGGRRVEYGKAPCRVSAFAVQDGTL
jgi:hypothetical protein